MHMDLSSSHLEQEDAATRIVLMAEAGKCFVSMASEEVPPQSCKAKFYHGGTCSHNNPRSTGPAELTSEKTEGGRTCLSSDDR